MLRAIKDEHLARHRLGRDQVRVLRHVARAVDLPGMVYPLHDIDARLCRRQRVPAELAALLVVRPAVEHVRTRPGARWDLHGRDLEVVSRLSGRVGAQQQAVGRVGLVGGAARGVVIVSSSGKKGGGLGPQDAHVSLSGNHWQVRLGQSSAWVIIRSYRYGAFFFLLRDVYDTA